MLINTLQTANQLGFVRPREYRGVRLWYVDSINYDPKKYKPRDPANAFAQMRLYRWFQNLSQDSIQMIEKDRLMYLLFSDTNLVTKSRVGRILSMILQYPTNFQKNPCLTTGYRNIQLWRWGHRLEVIYGLEYLMLSWIPWAIPEITDAGAYREELKFIVETDPSQDLEQLRNLIQLQYT